MPETPEELVLCLDAAALMRLFADKTGKPDSVWLPAEAAPVEEWLPGIRKAFLPRSEAEIMPEWRHVATYTLITSGASVFYYWRGKSGGESRLHDRIALGVGGHVTIEDYRQTGDSGVLFRDMICHAAGREVAEEVDIHSSLRWTFKGWIAASETPVDRVHLGSVWEAEALPCTSFTVREDCLAGARWATRNTIREAGDALESWSAIAAREVLGIPIGLEAPR